MPMSIAIDNAVHLLLQGEVVAIPTETVYGLAASANHLEAVKKIFSLKGRPQTNPLIIHIADHSQIFPYIQELPPGFDALAKAFWPGAMTLVLPVKKHLIFPEIRANLETAAFRIPNHPIALEILRKTGPVVAPSANLSGKPSSTSPRHVKNDFGNGFPIVDGGICQQGLESTILTYHKEEWKIVRLGSLPPEVFQNVLGYIPKVNGELKKAEQPICPGQTFRHYAPKCELSLSKTFGLQNHVIIGFEEHSYPRSSRFFSLGSLQNPSEAAHKLYDILRELDALHIPSATIDIDFPRDGLWATILERIQRASQKF